MPLIPYECDNCEYYFEVIQGYTEKRKKKCPSCRKAKLRQVFCAPHIQDGTPKTLGTLAERNRREMGKYKLEKLEKEQTDNENAKKLEHLKKAGVVNENATELPSTKTWYNPKGENLNKKLNKVIGDKKKTKKYIEEGKL